MKTIHLQEREKRRLEELLSLNILDTEKEEAFDRITKIASQMFAVPICLISLVDKDRQWFKSCVGLSGITETSREVAFCHHVVVGDKPMIVKDATKDPRFADNPLVTGELGLRFYAGAPLRTKKGNVIGTLCLKDTKPRKFTDEQMALLSEYAALVMSELELRNIVKENVVLSVAIEKSTTGVIISNPNLPDNPTIFVNKAFKSITGYEEDDVLGRNCRFLQGSGTDKATVAKISQAIKKGEGIIVEILNYKKDGTPFWNELKIDAIRDQEGNLTHFVGFQRDISERKRIAVEFAARKQRYKALFHSNNDAVYLIEPSGRFFEVNEACLKLTGYSDEELQNMHYSELIDEKYNEETRQYFKRVVENFESLEFETELIDKYGTKKILSVKATPIVIEDELIGLYGISKDITLIKESEKQLKIASKLVQSMREAVVIIDENGKIITVNDAYEKMFNRKKEEVLQKNISDRIKEQGLEEMQQEVRSTILTGNAWEGQINIKLTNGHLKSLWLRVDAIMDESGNRTNTVCLLRDLTEKEQIQNDVKLAGKIQSSFLPEPFDNKFVGLKYIFKPNQYVSGDFFNYKWIENDTKLAGVVFDAMGHGIATALQTSVLRVLFQTIAEKQVSLADKVKYINQEITKYLTDEVFVAGVYFEYDVKKQILHYVPCGINEFFIEKQGKVHKISNKAYCIGMFENVPFDEYIIDLQEGDIVHFLTDGITDVLHPTSKAENLFSILEQFCNQSTLQDDATVMSLFVKRQGTVLLKETVCVNDWKGIEIIKQQSSSLFQSAFDKDFGFVEISFNEALNNALKASTEVTVEIVQTNQEFKITVSDNGPGFNVNEKLQEIEEKNDQLMDELMWAYSESGRGIYLMKKLMDTIVYNDLGNQVTLYKNMRGDFNEDK
ncbi:PAS domain S-box protein [Bacillus sp. HMF5848]|uniref:PAS domain S-box protein n=1 Tax=Bacillus sp. HMF5848 TaxID=2495421 RepID=UPI000F7A5251|nr:PAS domain S-box protein [Bacillus sp. HMF5848]RSK27528.1 PAS domain S-box protein [Bacillus sp. HMF5848]